MINEMHEAIETICDFLAGKGGPWDWDDFLSVRATDPVVEEIRRFCLSLPDAYPAQHREHYCNETGLQQLRILLSKLETGKTCVE